MRDLSGEFALRRAVLNITSRCNLKCKLCVTGGPHYEEPPHYTLDFLQNTIDRFFNVVDYVEWYELSGGEPFVHESIAELIEYTMKYQSQFDKLLIITNGSIVPKQNILDVMQKYNESIMVFISDYGEKLSTKKEVLMNLMEDIRIFCKIKTYHGESQHFSGWVDYGDWNKRNQTEEELALKCKNCGATKMNGIFTTHAGTMHWCVRSAKGLVVDRRIPFDERSDYIDLFDDNLTVEEQRAKIAAMFAKPYFTACDYCDGDGENNVKRYPAAEQMEANNG